MPLGDSITESIVGLNSYRFWLYNMLINAGLNIDFVGNRSGVFGGFPSNRNFDTDHQAVTGIRADEVIPQLASIAGANDPDIVLLFLGTNDILEFQDVNSTLNDLSRIIDILREQNPLVKVLIAQITPTSRPQAQSIAILSQRIAQLANQKNQRISPVVAVDQFNGFSVALDTYDGLHPNTSGDIKIAGNFFNSIADLLFHQ